MKCPNCNADNAEGAKFCKKCGSSLEKSRVTHENMVRSISEKAAPKSSNSNTKIIIAVIAVLAVVFAGAFVAFSGMFGGEVPLHEEDFEIFTILAPDGSRFDEFSSLPSYANVGGFIYLENVGDYSNEVGFLGISTIAYSSVPDEFSLKEKNNGAAIYEATEDGKTVYLVEKRIDDYEFSLMGHDLDTLKKMADSIKITDKNKLSQQSESENTSTQSQAQVQQTAPKTTSSQPLKIEGGSFSTGSGLSDKTYAKIYVGSGHAGEKVQVQIFYSRDGNLLNDGNIVPKTVSSDGYVEVASADSYEYYPDYADISLYDSAGNLVDARSVALSPTSGSQTF